MIIFIIVHSDDHQHRDCYIGNIMMDADNLIPGGFHPQKNEKTPDLSRNVKPMRRCGLKEPVRYYFIDFGISSWFRDPDSAEVNDSEGQKTANKALRRLVKGNICQDKFPPELNSRKPYDPFLLDICILGDVMTKAFIDVSACQRRSSSFFFFLNRPVEIFQHRFLSSSRKPNVSG